MGAVVDNNNYLLVQFLRHDVLRLRPVQLRQVRYQLPQKLVHAVVLRVRHFLLHRDPALVYRDQHLLRLSHLQDYDFPKVD